MHIENMFLQSFRNYEKQNIELNRYLNIFYGQNAQGKTNIIESIFLLSTGKSHRTQKDSELINWKSNESRVSISYVRDDSKNTIDMYLKHNVKKYIKLNGVRLQKTGELLGNLNTVIFSPDHMKIIKEGPVERRRFIDIVLSQVKPGYYYNLCQYIKVLQQRNNLLVNAKANSQLVKTIDVWDEQLIEYGIKLIRERSSFINNINKLAAEVHKKITNNREELNISYKSSIDIEDEAEIKRNYIKDLELFRTIDLRRGITHKGPHRDELNFLINNNDVKTYGSQGQQRTSLLSLKIAELKFMEAEDETLPILLLDDVFSELDTERQRYLIQFIRDVQTVITSTDVEYFKNIDIEGYSLYNVSGGDVVKK